MFKVILFSKNLKLYIVTSAFLFLYMYTAFSQNKPAFGQLLSIDKTLEKYERDSLASAVYLYEYGDNYFEVRDSRIWLITKYHGKIKILSQGGVDQANIQIPYYRSDKTKERINDLKAVTHSSGTMTWVRKEDVFDVDVSENWSEKRFTFPKVDKGAILEYSYEIQSPFHFNLKGWEFQSDIPKLYSEYNAKIPGNWVYNRTLIGEQKLDVNEANLKKHCFSVPGTSDPSDCEELKYVMKDIPAFEESEEFMLSANNYKSRLEFELSEYKMLRGGTRKYTKSWKDVDLEFRTDRDIGSQLRKKNFFEKNVDPNLLLEGDPITRAKNIYAYVNDHFTWNEKYGIWHNNRVKNAFEERKGNVAEINIALINLLNASGIKTDMMLTATRKRGLPKKNHPVITDFNYIIAKAEIDGETYLLDATEKNMPFGMLPYRCLNYYGRVMDFDEESYWYDIVPEKRNRRSVRAQINLNLEGEKIEGLLDVSSTGYLSVSKRNHIASMKKEKYLEQFEKEIGSEFYVTSYEIMEKYSNEKKLTERFEFEVENAFQGSNIYIDPFLYKFFESNPFTSAKRSYPIDFGYLRGYDFMLNLKVPDGYRLKEKPQPKNMVLPDNLGILRFNVVDNISGIVNMSFSFRINKPHFSTEAFGMIRDFFSQCVDIQTHSLIVLEKI